MRRSSVATLKTTTNRRRSSVGYAASGTVGRRCSLSTFAVSSRIRSNSKGHVSEDDIEMCQPPLEELPTVAGYQDATFEPYAVPPPTLPVITEIDSDVNDDVTVLKTIPPISVTEARNILIRFADSKCVHNKDAARDMTITGMRYEPRLKYTLESFTETREVAWCYEPYTGEPLDEFEPSVPVPTPWSIDISAPQPFQLHTVTETVPHTDVLMTCHACGGVGSKRCNACAAAGWERCSFCLGDGHKISLQGHRERCFRCLGTGRKKCWKCGGDTIAVCGGCGGTGQIRCYIAMTVTWTNRIDNQTIEPPGASTLIDSKLEFAKGVMVFEEEKLLVNPINIPDSELRSLSSSLIVKHGEILETEKLILQKHNVCTIPVYCITYEWKQKTKMFFIYGLRNDVYAPGYPEQICCCTLL